MPSALLTIEDVRLAWDLAHSLALDSTDTWDELLAAYEPIDPLAVLPVHERPLENELVGAGAQVYRRAAPIGADALAGRGYRQSR